MINMMSLTGVSGVSKPIGTLYEGLRTVVTPVTPEFPLLPTFRIKWKLS